MPTMTAQGAVRVITAVEAAEAAQITYRQLDHWARRGWVQPSVQSGSGRGGRRLYSVDDVLRLAALCRFARSGWQVSALGEQVSAVALQDAAWLFVSDGPVVEACADDETLLEMIDNECTFSAYSLKRLRTKLLGIEASGEPAPPVSIQTHRRTA